LSRKHFGEFNDFVQKFAKFPEFNNVSQGITGVLQDLLNKTIKAQGTIIQARISDFGAILKEPISRFSERSGNLRWRKREINYEFLSCLVKEFENYIALHKWLYVDFTVVKAREIGLHKISTTTKRLYSGYKGDYNDFIVAYTQFAGRSAKEELRIFNQKLEKANEL